MNPLMLPNTLEESENWVEPAQRAAMDAGADSGPVYQKRLRVRQAERVLLTELEAAFASEAMAAAGWGAVDVSTPSPAPAMDGDAAATAAALAAAAAGPRSTSPPQLPPQLPLVEHLDEVHGLGLGLSQRNRLPPRSVPGKSSKSSKSGKFGRSGKHGMFPPTYDLSAPSPTSAPASALSEYSDEERRDVAFLNWHLAAQLQLHRIQGSLGEDLTSRCSLGPLSRPLFRRFLGSYLCP